MKRFNRTSKVATVGVIVTLGLAAAGVAFAYVTATGSGSGAGKVATASTLTGKLKVTISPCATPASILPGQTQTCGYKVHNTTAGQVHFGTNTVALTHTGTTIKKSTGAKVAGCKVAWFTVSVTTQPAPNTLAAAATASGGVVTLKMKTSATTTQNACLGSTPKFTVTVPA